MNPVTRRPDFVIIGAMKCATSTLHVQLGEHPALLVRTLRLEVARHWTAGESGP